MTSFCALSVTTVKCVQEVLLWQSPRAVIPTFAVVEFFAICIRLIDAGFLATLFLIVLVDVIARRAFPRP
jgi:hypothetical protein